MYLVAASTANGDDYDLKIVILFFKPNCQPSTVIFLKQNKPKVFSFRLVCPVAITDRETETAAAAEEDATAVTVAEVAAAADPTDPEDRLRPALTATFRKQQHHLFLHHNNNNNVSSSLFSVCFIFNSLFWLLLRHIL